MTDILGFTLGDALEVLESHTQALPVKLVETSGYRAQENLDNHTDIRVVGVRENEAEILLITARF